MRTQVIQDLNKYLPQYVLDNERNNSVLQGDKDNIPIINTSSERNEDIIIVDSPVFENDPRIISSFDESFLESLLNFDDTAGYIFSEKFNKLRVYKREIIIKLKQLYSGNCQICGLNFSDTFGVDITEAHHIHYYCQSLNNNKNNIVILCPNHHTLIHKINPTYNKEEKAFLFLNGSKMELAINFHL